MLVCLAASVVAAPSMLRIAANVITQDGVSGLFSGSSALLARAAAFNVAQLLTYDQSKLFVARMCGTKESEVTTHVLAACAAGLASTTVSNPFENVKTVMQMHGSDSGSTIHVIRQMCRSHGISSLFRGWLPLYLKVAPHTLCVFVALEQLRGIFGICGDT